jgi:hypothetical protein
MGRNVAQQVERVRQTAWLVLRSFDGAIGQAPRLAESVEQEARAT